jgi:hypothetical protein
MVEDLVSELPNDLLAPLVELGIGELFDPPAGDTDKVVVLTLADPRFVDRAPLVLQGSSENPRLLEQGKGPVDGCATDSMTAAANVIDQLLRIEVGGRGQDGAEQLEAFVR